MRNKIIRLYYSAKDISVRRFWENIGRWFSYFNISRRIYDFDYSSILTVERNQISRVRDSIAHYHNHLYAERDIERLNLALRLLDIIEEDGCCERVGRPFKFVKSNNKEDLYELEDDPESYYTIPVYVNYKNAMRFCKIELSRYTDSKDGAMWQSHLRVEKAWHIYHTLRLYFMRSWWD